jgi:septal ring factor EnvC (AmiA/AmiB activator)
MTAQERRHRRWLVAAAVGTLLCIVPALATDATGDNITQLHDKLGTTQSQLNGTKSREKALAGSIATLNGQVSSLAGQISIVQTRQAAAQERLATENARVDADQAAVARERRNLHRLHYVLSRAQRALADELRSQYEQPQRSFISLVVDSGGFQQLLDGLQDMSRAKKQEQSLIIYTRTARAKALAAAARLVKLESTDAAAANTAATQSNALDGMSALLNSRESALAHDRLAQATALAASQEQGSKLEDAISTIQKQEAAAQAAAQRLAVQHYSGTSLRATAGWAIPYAVVLCESGGQNLPPNGAGASGYYQIEVATWKDEGGTGPAAYLAPKSEQDAIAARLWNGGAGASNWTCARIVGIT